MGILIIDGEIAHVTDTSLNTSVANAGGGGLTTNTTIDLLVADSTAAKQAKIDAVPKNASGAYTTTFTFADGTHTETGTLTFEGFTYPIVIQGNDSDLAGLNTSQSVTIDASIVDAGAIKITDCSNVSVKFLKIIIPDSASTTSRGVWAVNCSYIDISFNYIAGSGKTNTSRGLNLTGCGSAYMQNNYVDNVNVGIESYISMLFSNINDDTSTAPNYGLFASGGGVVGKNGTQPTGTISNEGTSTGGVIR